MSQLYFNYVYAASASQTTTLKVTGEQQDEAPATPDEVVVVNVSAAELNSLMSVQAQSAAGVGYPAVSLDWISLASSTDPKWASFMGVTGPGVAPLDFTDNSTQVKPTLQKVFATQTFTYDTNATSPLLAIPPEAISDVDYSGAISLTRGGSSLSPFYMGGSADRILGSAITAESGDLGTADDKKAVRGLFLQALAAGKYQQSSPGVTGGSDLPAGASPGFNFATGDIVSVYTVLTLTKTRAFIADTTDVLPGAGGMKFKVDGSTVTIGDTNPADDSVASDLKTWTVEWKLTVA